MPALRELIASFGIDVDDREVKQADKTMAGFIGKLQAFGGLLAGGFVARAVATFVGDQIALGDQIATTASRLGIGTDALQELRYAAAFSDVEVNTLESSLQRFSRGSAEAAAGSGEAKDEFRRLGISLRDASGNLRPAESLLLDVANAIQGTTDQSERIRIAFKLFGRDGVSMVTMLQNGGDAIEHLRRAARQSGGILPPEMIAQTAAADDELKSFGAALQGIKTQLTLALLPAVRALITGAGGIMRSFAKLARETHVLEAGFVAAMVAAGLLYRASIRAAVAQLVAWAPMIAVFALVALGVAFVALLVDDLITTFNGGDSVIRRFIDGIFGIGATESAVNGIRLMVTALGNALVMASELAQKFAADALVLFGQVQAKAGELWAAIKSGAEALFAALPEPAQAAVAAILSFFRDTLLGGVLSVFERIKAGARGLVSMFGEGIYNLAFGAGTPAANQKLASQQAQAAVARVVSPQSSTSTTTNNRRMELNVNVQAHGTGAQTIGNQVAQDIGRVLRNEAADLLGAHAGEV